MTSTHRQRLITHYSVTQASETVSTTDTDHVQELSILQLSMLVSVIIQLVSGLDTHCGQSMDRIIRLVCRGVSQWTIEWTEQVD